MITTIPFSGFYESIHSGIIDDTEGQMFQNERGDPNAGLSERFYYMADYSAVFQNYAKEYAERFAEEFEIDLKFESLSSPREYNFTTDRIFCEISIDEVVRIAGLVDRKKLGELARERFTSRSGFISHYSSEVEDWGTLEEWDHNQIGTLVEAFIGEFEEWSIVEDFNGNGEVSNWIYGSVPTEKRAELNRLFRIADYLRHRENRDKVWYQRQQGQEMLTF